MGIPGPARRGEPGGVYHEFSRFDDLDDRSEAALAVDAFTWLRSVVEGHGRRSRSTTTAATRSPRSASAGRPGSTMPLLDWAAAYAEEHFVDLLEIVKAHYLRGRRARAEADGRARGLQLARRRSRRPQLPAVVRRGGARRTTAEVRSAARHRVLEYNEDDVIATSQLRAWLRAQ